MCVSLSNAGLIFWAIGVAIAFGGGMLMHAAHEQNVKRAREESASMDDPRI